jgi:hypothetical protein
VDSSAGSGGADNEEAAVSGSLPMPRNAASRKFTMTQPNPFSLLKALFAKLQEVQHADQKMRIDLMFADIGPDTPVTDGIRAHGDTLIDIIDGAVHAIQTLERQFLSQDKAA